jgi:hypothetical protein
MIKSNKGRDYDSTKGYYLVAAGARPLLVAEEPNLRASVRWIEC